MEIQDNVTNQYQGRLHMKLTWLAKYKPSSLLHLVPSEYIFEYPKSSLFPFSSNVPE